MRGAFPGQYPKVESERQFLVAQRVHELCVATDRHLHGDVSGSEEPLHSHTRRDLLDPVSRVGAVAVGAEPEFDEPWTRRGPARLNVGAQQPCVADPGGELRPTGREEVLIGWTLHTRPHLDGNTLRGAQVQIRPELGLGDLATQPCVGEIGEGEPSLETAEIRSDVERATPTPRVRPAGAERVIAPVEVDPQRKVLVVQVRQIEDIPARVGRERDAVTAPRPTLYDRLEIGQMVRDLFDE